MGRLALDNLLVNLPPLDSPGGNEARPTDLGFEAHLDRARQTSPADSSAPPTSDSLESSASAYDSPHQPGAASEPPQDDAQRVNQPQAGTTSAQESSSSSNDAPAERQASANGPADHEEGNLPIELPHDLPAVALQVALAATRTPSVEQPTAQAIRQTDLAPGFPLEAPIQTTLLKPSRQPTQLAGEQGAAPQLPTDLTKDSAGSDINRLKGEAAKKAVSTTTLEPDESESAHDTLEYQALAYQAALGKSDLEGKPASDQLASRAESKGAAAAVQSPLGAIAEPGAAQEGVKQPRSTSVAREPQPVETVPQSAGGFDLRDQLPQVGEASDAVVSREASEAPKFTPPMDTPSGNAGETKSPTTVGHQTSPTSTSPNSEASPAVTRSTTANSGSAVHESDRYRFLQRVARAFQVASDGSGQVRLRLSPPELGSLQLEVSVHQGVLTARVEAETPQARMLLLEGLPALRERLGEQNIKIERFEVDLMNQFGGGLPKHHAGKQAADSMVPTAAIEARAKDARLATEDASRQPPPRLGDSRQLNVVV